MDPAYRRSFLCRAGAGVMAFSGLAARGAASPNQRLTIGIIGCGGQGTYLANQFARLATIATVCDPDQTRREKLKAATGAMQAVADVRKVLDDPNVDAVVIATPDHWHAPIAILACAAGKHVYVEKPQSHNLRESELLVRAARAHGVVVQHGTQSRSNPLIAGGIQLLREGVIGEVKVAKAWNIQRRRNIGHEQPTAAPADLDYDLWLGPAEAVPYQANRLHYNWRWWHNFGTGDIGNDGTHEIDYARWGLGVSGLPASVAAVGGKYAFDDDQQFPDTATCIFEWPEQAQPESTASRPCQLVFEMRLWNKNYPFNCDSGVEFLGTAGRMLLSKRGKLEVYDDDNKRLPDIAPAEPPQLAASHQQDFIDAILAERRPAADVGTGHDTVALVHLANVALQVKRSLQLQADSPVLVDDEEAAAKLTRRYRAGGHWAIPAGVA